MIRLTLTGNSNPTPREMESPYFGISGGTVWTRLGSNPLLRYAGARWQYDGRAWSSMRFDGKCRLVFGLPRDPAGVSGLLTVVTICACTLSCNGIPCAVYEPSLEMWRAATSEMWWQSFRLESLSLRPLENDSQPRRRSTYVVVPPLGPTGSRSSH
jgi:hypothetical protein